MIDLNSFHDVLFAIVITIPRMAGVFWTVPFLSKRILPGMLRNSILLCFVPILYPLVSEQLSGQIDSAFFVIIIILKEVLIGFVLGFMISIAFWVAESIGILIDNQRGAMSALFSDPMEISQSTPWGNYLFHLTIILFFVSGGFLDLMSCLFESYTIWPIVSFFPKVSTKLTLFFIHQIDYIMRYTVILAAPVVIASFSVEFGLGLMNRFAPQLNVFFLSMGLKSATCVVVMIIYIQFLLHYFNRFAFDGRSIITLMKNIMV